MSSTASNTKITDQDNPVNEKREVPRKKKDKEKTKRMLARLRKPVMPKMMMTKFMVEQTFHSTILGLSSREG